MLSSPAVSSELAPYRKRIEALLKPIDQFFRHPNRNMGERGLYRAAMPFLIFMGADYARNRDGDGEPTKAFEPSLSVWATVMSRRPRTAPLSTPA
jgi:hypothetical protein